jgi:hypothetical protein
MTFVLRCPAGRIMNARSYGRLNLDGVRSGKIKTLSCEEALRTFVRQQLRPVLFRDEVSRYIRLFALESAHPGNVFVKFMATNTVSYLTTAVDIVRRFLPPGSERRVALCVAIWLTGAAFSCGTERCSRKSRSALARTSRSPMN